MLHALFTRAAGAAIPWRAVGLGALALAIGGAILVLALRLDAVQASAQAARAERDLARAHRDTLEQALGETLEAVEQVQAAAARNEAALTAELAATADRARRFARIREEVTHATNAHPAGCVGPAVSAALDGLRRGAGGTPGDEGADRPADGARRPAGVQP